MALLVTESVLPCAHVGSCVQEEEAGRVQGLQEDTGPTVESQGQVWLPGECPLTGALPPALRWKPCLSRAVAKNLGFRPDLVTWLVASPVTHRWRGRAGSPV